MLGLFCRAAALTACGAAAFAAFVPSARACSPIESPSVWPQLPPEQLADVPTNGVLAFHAQTFGQLDDVLAMIAVDVTLDGVAVEGAIETVTRTESSVFGEEARDLFVVWRPTAELAPDTVYDATIRFTASRFSEEESATVTLTTASGPAGSAVQAGLIAPLLSVVAVGVGERVCCDDGNTCGFPACAAPASEDRAQLSATIDAAAGTLARQGYVQIQHGTDESFGDPWIVGLAEDAHDANIVATLPEIGAEYCLAVEYISFIDGLGSGRLTMCMPGDALELGAGPNPTFEGMLEQCIGEPYWEDTEQPYEPDGGSGGTDGGDGGSDGDGDGGDGGSDGDGGDGGSGGDGGGDGGAGLDEDARGCACHVDGPSSPWTTALGLFVIGAFVRRRGRATIRP